ncbi:hypothetical protein MKX01_003523 [Papaver californicum]|nr:hypothetical protein MKX01_003523 [Papaver californicum]
MACMKLGSKSESFRRQSQIWLCATGLPSDVIIEVGDMSFHLHKYDMPGGAQVFALVAKFCYGVKIELTSQNVVGLRCAAEHLQMNESYGEENLIEQTKDFLIDVFGNWADSLKALAACDEVLPHAEEVHIVSRCINSLETKACADPSAFCCLRPGGNNKDDPQGEFMWNGIRTRPNPHHFGEDWWYEDVSLLSLPLYKRFIMAVESKEMIQESIAGSLMFYGKRYLPGRLLLEEIVELLPNEKGVTRTRFLLRLLRIAMLLRASPSCRENLEKRVGTQLDQATLDDLLIPNMGFTVETLYDVDCVQRILDHFMTVDQTEVLSSSPCIIKDEYEEKEDDEGVMDDRFQPLTPVTMVAKLVDGYLAEVATDVNLKLLTFQSLAAGIPDYARQLDDGLYRAIDIYLKAHPWLVDSEKEQLCRLMNCQKLSLEACTHAAQNERLPLHVIVQVLFFEQLRLHTSVTGWFFVSDNIENSHAPVQNLPLFRNNATSQSNRANYQMEDQTIGIEDMSLRVLELEKECSVMKLEIEKMEKTKSSSWNFLSKLGFKKSQASNSKTSKWNSSNAPPNT